jgi:hypothetical protein
MKQDGGGGLTPPPGTGGVSNGGRTPSECGGVSSQNSDDSEGERKRERGWGVVLRRCGALRRRGGLFIGMGESGS